MIELNNISAKNIIRYDDYAIERIIKETGAKSVHDVLKLMEEHPEYNWIKIYRDLADIKRQMNLANKRGHEPEIYSTKGYQEAELEAQDSLNYGNILLLDNPAAHNRVRFTRLKDKTIAEIKEDLAHTTGDGRNYICAGKSGYRNIGSDKLPRIVSQIEMYEEQIERQSRLTNDREINLFELDKDERMEIAAEMYNEIIMYLVYNANERLVWSEFTDLQKKIYLSSAINKKKSDYEAREKIQKNIANYTTLPELEEISNHNLKVLKDL